MDDQCGVFLDVLTHSCQESVLNFSGRVAFIEKGCPFDYAEMASLPVVVVIIVIIVIGVGESDGRCRGS
jgi:hypothetical protein